MQMRAYEWLRELVKDCGGVLVDEEINPKNAGPTLAVFSGRAGNRFRFAWDRKRKTGLLQVEGEKGVWIDQEPVIVKTPGATYSNLHDFMVKAERLAGIRTD
jgi:hypothetical protein